MSYDSGRKKHTTSVLSEPSFSSSPTSLLADFFFLHLLHFPLSVLFYFPFLLLASFFAALAFFWFFQLPNSFSYFLSLIVRHKSAVLSPLSGSGPLASLAFPKVIGYNGLMIVVYKKQEKNMAGVGRLEGGNSGDCKGTCKNQPGSCGRWYQTGWLS